MLAALIVAQAVAAPPAAMPAPASLVTFEGARSLPVTPGTWQYQATAQGSESRFAGMFTIRCERASRTVILQRPAAVPATQPLMIATDTLTRQYASSTVSLRSTDALLDSIALSRGRFVVSGGGGGALVIPAWPEAARSIEDCRN